MIQHLLQLPLHSQLVVLLLLGSTLLCLLTGGLGWGATLLQRQTARVKLPPIPLHPWCNFPGRLDQLYTLVFLLYYVALCLIDCISKPGENVAASFSPSWGIVLLNFVIYLPMVIRYACLPTWERPRLSFGRVLAWISGALALIYAGTFLLTVTGFHAWLLRTTGAPEYQPIVDALRTCDTGTRLRIIVSAVLIAPIAEECCFRGFLYSILRRWSGFFAAMLSSSLLFGAIHTSLMQFLPLTVFAMVQCWVYERTRTLWIPILTHCVFNAISVTALLLLPELERISC